MKCFFPNQICPYKRSIYQKRKIIRLYIATDWLTFTNHITFQAIVYTMLPALGIISIMSVMMEYVRTSSDIWLGQLQLPEIGIVVMVRGALMVVGVGLSIHVAAIFEFVLLLFEHVCLFSNGKSLYLENTI